MTEKEKALLFSLLEKANEENLLRIYDDNESIYKVVWMSQGTDISVKVKEVQDMCIFCNLENAKKRMGITINDFDDTARLFICFDDCYTEDGKPHYHIRSEINHIDASVQINYCPFCGRKLQFGTRFAIYYYEV